MNPAALLQQRIRQFLVHSFLYYQLNDPVIADVQYDLLCRELKELLTAYRGEPLPFQTLAQETLGNATSGFSLKTYPSQIISSALHLLYQHSYTQHFPFEVFLARLGYQCDGT